MSASEFFLFTGSFSKQAAQGILSFHYDVSNKMITRIGTFGNYVNMSCMAADDDLLITCSESAVADSLITYRIMQDGSLVKLHEAHIGGCSIAHLLIEPSKRYIIASSMASSKVILARYEPGGSISVLDEIKFEDPGSFELGFSANPRQGKARIHSAFIMPDGRHIQVCNLGSDKIYTLELDTERNKLTLLPELTYTTEGGEGPRHAVYSKDGKFAYFNAEMGNHIYVFSIAQDCSMKLLQKVSTLDPSRENPTGGETSLSVMSGDGRFILCGNRGQNNIAKFAVGGDGCLTPEGYYDCYGNMPRGLTLGYNDEVLFCGNNRSGTVTVINFNKLTGTPGECLQTVDGVPGAANILWVEYRHK